MSQNLNTNEIFNNTKGDYEDALKNVNSYIPTTKDSKTSGKENRKSSGLTHRPINKSPLMSQKYS